MPLMEAFDRLQLPQLNRNLFSSFDWTRVIYKTYGLQLFVKYLEKEGEVVSYIGYSVVRNFLEWKICVGSYCDYLDCYVQSSQHWDIFVESLRAQYPQYRIAVRNLRDETARSCKYFKVLSKERFHEMDVRESLEDIRRSTYKTFREACARPRNMGVKVKECPRSELRTFYNLHLRLRKTKYKLFPQPYRFFEIIWDQYIANGKGVLLGAYDRFGDMIGASMFLVCADTLYYKFSTSRMDAIHLNPNKLLIWEGICYAKKKDLNYVDLGSSGWDQEGLIWFKNHICKLTKQYEITHLGFSPPTYKFSQKRVLKLYTKLFTQSWMPDRMVEFGSNFIYPFLA